MELVYTLGPLESWALIYLFLVSSDSLLSDVNAGVSLELTAPGEEVIQCDNCDVN